MTPFESTGEKSRVCTQRHGARSDIFRKSAGEYRQTVGALAVRKAACGIGWPRAESIWCKPNLEELERHVTAIEFGVTQTRSGAHDLHITGTYLVRVAEGVFVRDGAGPDVGDDFDIAVEVQRKSVPRRELVVVPDVE